jgi:hypothetical protein
MALNFPYSTGWGVCNQPYYNCRPGFKHPGDGEYESYIKPEKYNQEENIDENI